MHTCSENVIVGPVPSIVVEQVFESENENTKLEILLKSPIDVDKLQRDIKFEIFERILNDEIVSITQGDNTDQLYIADEIVENDCEDGVLLENGIFETEEKCDLSAFVDKNINAVNNALKMEISEDAQVGSLSETNTSLGGPSLPTFSLEIDFKRSQADALQQSLTVSPNQKGDLLTQRSPSEIPDSSEISVIQFKTENDSTLTFGLLSPRKKGSSQGKSKVEVFQCQYCEKKFTSEQVAQNHISTIHT
ncbi:hypothetical protein AVEN_64171-1, partial [Araneus ventricosus]